MKKINLLLLLIMPMFLLAQQNPITSITISLPQNPDANTIKWTTGASMLTITAMTKTVNGRMDPLLEGSKVLVNIKKSGTTVCGSNNIGSAPQANLAATNKVWSGNAAVALLGQECTLPPGDYELCVRFYGGPRNAALSEEKCKAFSIRSSDAISYQSPQLLTPANNSSIKVSNINPPLTFRWTPLIPRPQEPTTYNLKVWQLMEGQNSTQAINSNNPIIDTKVENLTQTVVNRYEVAPCKNESCGNFVWNVQALNRDGKPIGGNNGTSELFAFSFNKDKIESPIVLKTPANNSTIQIGSQVQFRWIAPQGDNELIYYKIKIVEIKGDESPESAIRGNKPFFERDSLQAFKGNKPHFEKDSLQEISYDYTADAPKLQEGKTYVWRIQAKDKNGRSVGKNDGFSEVWMYKMSTPGSCSVNIDSVIYACKGYNSLGLPIYTFKIYLKNNSTTGTTYLGHTFTTNSSNGNAIPPTNNGNYVELFNSTGAITTLSPATNVVTTISPSSTQIITGEYSLKNWKDTCFRIKVWASTLINSGGSVTGNACQSIKDTCLKPCICSDCDNAILTATAVQATQVSGNPSQYNIAGSFSFSGLPQNIQAIEVQVQNFSFNNSPNACSNGVQSVATSGVLINPSTTINNNIPIFQNVTVLNNANISKNVKLIIGGSGLPQPTSIPFNLTVGVPAPLSGLPADCCKIEYEICFKVIVYYGSSPGNCKYCEFIFCKSFSNQ